MGEERCQEMSQRFLEATELISDRGRFFELWWSVSSQAVDHSAAKGRRSH